MQKRLGPAWGRRGRPPAGYFTKHTAAAWLDDTLSLARRGELVGAIKTGSTFSEAADEWLRYVERERACKPATIQDYRAMVGVLNRWFGDVPVEEIATDRIEQWKAAFAAEQEPTNRTLQKYLVTLNGIFRRARRVYSCRATRSMASSGPG